MERLEIKFRPKDQDEKFYFDVSVDSKLITINDLLISKHDWKALKSYIDEAIYAYERLEKEVSQED